jgi:hypothetical protein
VDGITGLIFIVAFVVAWQRAKAEHELAKKGIVPPRMEAKYGRAGARSKVDEYGFWDHFRDIMRDHWARRTDAVIAARDAKAANPKAPLRDRWRASWAAAKTRFAGVDLPAPDVRRSREGEAPADRTITDPGIASAAVTDEAVDGPSAVVLDADQTGTPTIASGDTPAEAGNPAKTDPTPAPAPTDQPSGSPSADTPAERSTVRPQSREREDGPDEPWVLTQHDRERLRPELFGKCAHRSRPGAGFAYEYCDNPVSGDNAYCWEHDSTTDMDASPAGLEQAGNDSTGGSPMTAPTGEAVNYETTLNELQALAKEQQQHIDHCQEALKSISEAKAAINNMQESYRASSQAAASTSDHLGALNLDEVTLSNAGTTADAMPAGAVDAMYDHLEEMEAQAQQRLSDAEVALGATEANISHIQATYGDAHDTVASNLSGDASFLHSGVGGAAGGAGSGTISVGAVNGGTSDVAPSAVPVGAATTANSN